MSKIKNFTLDLSTVTTEDLVNSIIDGASKVGYKINFEVKQFMSWYYQAGTPHVYIKREWNSKKDNNKWIDCICFRCVESA